MSTQAESLGTTGARSGKGTLWAGRILTAIPIAMLLFSAGIKLARPPQMIADFTGKFGYPEATLLGIALAELGCALLYAFPRTAVLGAILLTGYLGGATATHVRISDSFVAPVLVGVFAWAGLFLREERLRALLPLRRDG